MATFCRGLPILLSLAAALAGTACGGTQAPRPAPDAGEAQIDPCAASDGYLFSSIEDFEKGRAVNWWANDDESPGGSMAPAPGSQSPPASEIFGGRCGTSQYGLHLTARKLTIWGGSVGVYFFSGPTDATAWDGISFWARRGLPDADSTWGAPDASLQALSGRTLFVAVDDRYTDEVHGAPLFPDRSPFCFEEPQELSDKCDRFVAAVGLTAEWRFLAIPFAKMQQRGFGRQAPELDLTALLGLEFDLSTGDWDVWIDDVAFYRRSDP